MECEAFVFIDKDLIYCYKISIETLFNYLVDIDATVEEC